MLYLLITIIGGVIASLAYKASAEMGCRRMHHLMVERAILVLGFVGLGIAFGGMAVTGEVIVVSSLAGISLWVARWALLKALSLGHSGITFTFWKLSLAIPVLVSIFLWGETPGPSQIIGLALVPACLLLLRDRVGNEGADRKMTFGKALYPALLCAAAEGIFLCCFKWIDVHDLGASRNLFLVLYNVVVLAAIVVATYSRDWSLPSKKEYLSGTAGGLGLIIGGYFGILAVLQVSGIIFFPVASAGVLLMTVIFTHLVWKEKTSIAQWLGIALSALAIVFVSST
jgi:uncharacterized membrane protein